jgi:DNA-binding Xre family transcriptional regulator
VKRKIGYFWRLREVMATRGIFTATELVPLLKERGIDLSASQVHRLVSGTPERLSLQVLSAFCDILGCTPADLVTTTAENAGVRKTATDDRPTPPTAPNYGPGLPGSSPTNEPCLLHARAVRALAQADMRPLRPVRLFRRRLAGRAGLPDL